MILERISSQDPSQEKTFFIKVNHEEHEIYILAIANTEGKPWERGVFTMPKRIIEDPVR